MAGENSYDWEEPAKRFFRVVKKNCPLIILTFGLAILAACQETPEENRARHLSSYYAQKGEKLNPTAQKVDQRNPRPNATPTPPTQAAPAPGRY